MNTKPIYTFAKWQVKQGHLDTVLTLLGSLAQKSQEEKGNLHYNTYQSTTDANTIILFEGYADEAALQEHRNSQHFQHIAIGQIIPLLESREVTLATYFSN
ncbi:MAG: putative quinol monooxygenase [Taibaiella sp.]|jgi:quinol monooxygenase YgiN